MKYAIKTIWLENLLRAQTFSKTNDFNLGTLRQRVKELEQARAQKAACRCKGD